MFRKCLFILGFILFLSGLSCANLGTLRLVSGPDEKGKIEFFIENMADYRAFYDGRSGGGPVAVLFDPIKDDKKLVGETWTEVGDQEQLKAIISEIQFGRGFFIKLYKILGPGDQVFGYMYSKRKDVNIRVVDSNTLLVDGFPPPSYGP